MTAPTPGSWLKKAPTERATPATTSSPKTQQTGKESSSTPSKNSSAKARTYSNAKCECGHRRGDHHVDVYTPEEAALDQNVLDCTKKDCDCTKYKKAPYVRPEHLTNRPFAENTGLIVLKDRLTVHDGTKQAQRRNKKGKKR